MGKAGVLFAIAAGGVMLAVCGLADFARGDDALVQAMRFFAERMKLVVEPTGALGAAAAFSGQADVRGKRVGVIISGGNVALDRYAQLLAG
jgi:threonine dehydratase